MILDKLASKPALNICGETMTFNAGLTQMDIARNGALRAAAQELAKDNRFTGMTIKREIGHDDRGITADGVCMFWQVAVGAVLSSRHTLI